MDIICAPIVPRGQLISNLWTNWMIDFEIVVINCVYFCLFICRYTIKYSLKRHLLYDHSDPKFECGKCQMKFRYNFQRVNHMKIHHKRRRWSHTITNFIFMNFVRTVDWLEDLWRKFVNKQHKKRKNLSNSMPSARSMASIDYKLKFRILILLNCWIKIQKFCHQIFTFT